MSWLKGWTYRKSVTLSRASGAVTNYQMKLLVGESSGATGENVDCGGLCLSSLNDLRFTKADGTTLLDYWIESISGTTPNQLATIWIEFDSIGTDATTFYMYYGKADASAVSNGANTFIFFEDFNSLNDGDLNGQNSWSGSTAWDVQASVKYEGAKAAMISNAASATIDHAVNVSSYNAWIEMMIRGSNVSKHFPLAFYLMEGANTIVGSAIYQNNLQHLYASAWENVLGISADTWYKVKIALDSASTHKTWVNDDLKSPVHSSNFTNVTSSVNKILLQQDLASGVGTGYYVDTIKVGQYLATEPAWGTWGDMENQSDTQNYLHVLAGPDEYAAGIDTESVGVIMKQCPLNPDLECENCRMNFGPKKCGIFSIAADMSYLVELVEELIALLKKR